MAKATTKTKAPKSPRKRKTDPIEVHEPVVTVAEVAVVATAIEAPAGVREVSEAMIVAAEAQPMMHVDVAFVAPSEAEIRRRAYELYVAGGRDAFDNWVRAERELYGRGQAEAK